MTTSLRIELNSAGVREAALTSPQIRAAVEAKAEEIAARARSGAPMVEGKPGDVPLPIAVIPAHGKTRARALVIIDHPSGEAVEARDRVLGRALG